MTSHRWTKADEDYLRRHYPDPNVTMDDIIERLGRARKTIVVRANGLGLYRYGGRARPTKNKPPANTRKCMCCSKEFRSEGIHNRLCSDCRRRD